MDNEEDILTLNGDLLEMDTEDEHVVIEDDELGGEIGEEDVTLTEPLAITIEPDEGLREDLFKATVYNAKKDSHTIKIRTDIKYATDPVIATRKGDGSVSFYGRDLLSKTGAKEYSDTQVNVYAQEDIPWGIDRESARTPVTIKAVPGVTPPVEEGMPYITITPTAGYRDTEFTITIKGAPEDEKYRRVDIYAVKEGWGTSNDQLVVSHPEGNGTVKVLGSQLLKGIDAPSNVDKLLSIYPALVYPVFDPGSAIRVMIYAEPVVVPPGETPGEPGTPGEPVCTEGDVVGSYVCSGGKWVPVGETPPPTTCTEGTYSADRTMVCRGGTWVPVSAPPGPGVTPKYLTVSEADERVRTGLPCYIKCTLPVLNMLPGIPYTQGIPILPGFVITTVP